MKLTFEQIKKAKTLKYDGKGIWKDALKLNARINEMLNSKGLLLSHESWRPASEEIVDEQEQRGKRKLERIHQYGTQKTDRSQARGTRQRGSMGMQDKKSSAKD